jgi:hypothetical protein
MSANATSYIPTVASTVTRNADVISKTGIADLIGQSEGTLFAEVDFSYNDLGVEQCVFELGDNTTVNRLILSKTSSANDFAVVITKNTSGYVARTSSVVTTGKYKLAVRYNLTSISLFVNGTKHETIIAPQNFSNTISRIDFGNRRGGGGNWNGNINSLVIMKSFKTDAECITLTTL